MAFDGRSFDGVVEEAVKMVVAGVVEEVVEVATGGATAVLAAA